jgi:hypothetical protein
MDTDERFIVIRILRRSAFLISNILRGASSDPHNEAARLKSDSDRARHLRQEGDDIHQVAKDIEREMNRRD